MILSRQDSNKTAAAVIRMLLEHYGLSEDDLLSEISRRGSGFSKKVARRWVQGSTQPRTKGREALAQYFQMFNPDVSEYWFERNEDYIREKLTIATRSVNISLPNVRHDTKTVHDVADVFNGDWILKRFAFDNSGRIAREILTIRPYCEGIVPVKLYGVTSSSVGQASKYQEQVFEGQLDVLGELIVITLAFHNNFITRYRSITFKKPLEIHRLEPIQWGIVTGYSSKKSEPASARILLLSPSHVVSQPKSTREKHLGFRNIGKEEVAKLRLLSNDIKKHHVSQYEDFVLTTSEQDLHELADTDKNILQHLT